MQDIRVTTLGSYNTCAFKAANDTYEADWNNTYKGDILNMYATGREDLAELMLSKMQLYGNEKNQDIKLSLSIRQAGQTCMKYITELKEKYGHEHDGIIGFVQEMMMVLPFNKDINIVGTPDIFFYAPEYDNPDTIMLDGSRGISRPDGIYVVEDLKMSTHKWYGNDNIWNESMQWLCYPLFIMQWFGVDEAIFNFQVFDSGNGTRKCFSKHITKKEAIAKIAQAVFAYQEYLDLGVARPTEGRYCRGMCKVKDICPAFNKFTPAERVL